MRAARFLCAVAIAVPLLSGCAATHAAVCIGGGTITGMALGAKGGESGRDAVFGALAGAGTFLITRFFAKVFSLGMENQVRRMQEQRELESMGGGDDSPDDHGGGGGGGGSHGSEPGGGRGGGSSPPSEGGCPAGMVPTCWGCLTLEAARNMKQCVIH